MLRSVLLIVGSVGIPVALLVATMLTLKWLRKRENRRSPLTDKLFHQPGEQLRQRIRGLEDDIDERLARLFVIGPVLLLAILLPAVDWRVVRFDWDMLLVLVFGLAFIAWNVRSVWTLWKARADAQAGLSGELASAQELNRLLAKDCVVFHDVPGSRGNLDHVVVAPSAVFVVETKWRSKRGNGKASAEVLYDGETLQFPSGFKDRAPLEQASACARELAKDLLGKTGEPVRVIPVVSLPGWFVRGTPGSQQASVKVLNPKLAWTLLEPGAAPIPAAQRRRIIDRIAERYPDARD
jgi:hypothetical protein